MMHDPSLSSRNTGTSYHLLEENATEDENNDKYIIHDSPN